MTESQIVEFMGKKEFVVFFRSNALSPHLARNTAGCVENSQVTFVEIRTWGLPIKKPTVIHKSCDQSAATTKPNIWYCEFVLVATIQS